MAAPHLASEVILIPKQFPSPSRREETVKRYKQLRLHGLKADPASFTSTYEQESQFPPEIWQGRILNQGSKTFVAAIDFDASPTRLHDISPPKQPDTPPNPLQRLLEKEWVGIVTVLGPSVFPEQNAQSTACLTKPWQLFIQDGKYQIPPAVPTTEDLSGAHVVYLIVGMFVLPHARRKGHARRLLDAAAEAVKSEAQGRGASKATITVEVQSGNVNGEQLYERAGYQVVEDAVAMKNQRGESSFVKSLAKSIEIN